MMKCPHCKTELELIEVSNVVNGEMSISKNGLDLIKEFEGFRSAPYFDPVGIPTIGYGTTKYNDDTKVTMNDPDISKEAATNLLEKQVNTIYGKAVNDETTNMKTQQQFDALTSFTYNLGVGNLNSSTLLKKHNAKDYIGASNEFKKWVYAGGVVLNGLVRRKEGVIPLIGYAVALLPPIPKKKHQ